MERGLQNPKINKNYLDFIKTLSEDERANFWKFCEEKTKNLSQPVNDIEAWLAHKNKAGTPSKDSPSKARRHKGLGSGSIQWKTITLHGKDYPQAWYHYEFWKDGNRLVKKCKYIPKRLLSRIEKLEADKAPVREILLILRVKL